MRRSPLAVVCAVSAAVVLGWPGVAHAAKTGNGETWRVNRSATGVQPNKPSTRARISADGNFVVWQTKAANTVTPDNGLWQDIFWTNLLDPTHTVKRVSDTWTGAQANNHSDFAEISRDGRYVVFSSQANNITKDAKPGVFIRDMRDPNPASAIRFVAGGTRPVVSDDGRYVAYNTLPVSASEVFVRDMTKPSPRRITQKPPTAPADTESLRPEISGDGTHVVFASDLRILPDLDTNSSRDVYRADLRPWQAGSTTSLPITLVSVGLDGKAAGGNASRPGINGTGTVLSFQSSAANLVTSDSNGKQDAFVRDLRNPSAPFTKLVSYTVTGTIPPTDSSRPQLDASGDIVTFVSTAGKIVNGDTNGKEDAFVRNWKLEQPGQDGLNTHTYLLAVSPTGVPGTCVGMANVDEGTKAISTRPYLSANGRTAVFISGDCNLTADAAHGAPDTNLLADVFVRRYPAI